AFPVARVVYAKRPFAGPQAVLAYLARYTHRVAISNSRLIALDDKGVTFKWKDYRIKGRDRIKTMTLDAGEFIRRFLLHVLPSGFHRIRHYGLLAGAVRADNIARARQLLAAAENAPQPSREADSRAEDVSPARRCPCCGGRMIVVETFEGPHPWRSPSPRIPPRTVDRLRLQPRAGTRAQRPSEVARPLATEANASLLPIVAIENGQRRRFRRSRQAPPIADASLASRPRPSIPHRRARQTVPLPPPAVSSLGANQRLRRAIMDENGGGAGRFIGAYATGDRAKADKTV